MDLSVNRRNISPQHLLIIREQISLFGALSDVQVMAMSKYLAVNEYPSKKTIFKQGDLPSDIYIVLKGKVNFDLSLGVIERRELLPGNCFGESALIGIQPQVGSAEVMPGSELMVLSSQSLTEIFESDVALFGILMMNISREVSRRFYCFLERCEKRRGEYSRAIAG